MEVLVENETVWLSQAQMVTLFERHVSVISRHIKNVFSEGELEEKSNLHFLQIANADRPVAFYSLDVIISVGYRVKSQRGTEFRIWATKTLRDYVLKGYVVNQRFERVERRLENVEDKIDFFVRTSLPPVEGVFYNGQIFDAYKFVADLIEMAKKEIVVIDNYIDVSILALLTKRKEGVKATIFTANLNKIQTDLNKHNAQYAKIFVEEKPNIHDRFIVIDNDLYHIGASLKDLGKKLFAFSKMEMPAADLLKNMG
ncbi:DNA-binding protein [Bacteroidia bacterium]|nr:DNA-binding protein [Bacteroidia bacterium]